MQLIIHLTDLERNLCFSCNNSLELCSFVFSCTSLEQKSLLCLSLSWVAVMEMILVKGFDAIEKT